MDLIYEQLIWATWHISGWRLKFSKVVLEKLISPKAAKRRVWIWLDNQIFFCSLKTHFALFYTHRRQDCCCLHDPSSDMANHCIYSLHHPGLGVHALPPLVLSETLFRCLQSLIPPLALSCVMKPSTEGRDGSECDWQVKRGKIRCTQMFWESLPRSACSVIASPLL